MVIVIAVYVMNRVAVVMVLHVRVHICLIVAEMVRSVVVIVVRIIVPVVRRTPVRIVGTTKTVIQRRANIVHRLDDIARTIDVRRTDDLYVLRSKAHLHHDGGNILIDVGSQNRLDEQHMVAAFDGLKHAQIVDVTVVVEVEVGDHVGVRVQYHLKLLDT